MSQRKKELVDCLVSQLGEMNEIDKENLLRLDQGTLKELVVLIAAKLNPDRLPSEEGGEIGDYCSVCGELRTI